jgi:hypothetical protein
MNETIAAIISQCESLDGDENGYFTRFNKEKFSKLMVEHAIECVRDVLRDENCDLTYDGAQQVQDRLREYFGITNN